MSGLWSKITQWRLARQQARRQKRVAAVLQNLPPAAHEMLARDVAFLREQGVRVNEIAPGEDMQAPPRIGKRPL